jgi:hypothetical protein
MKTAGQKPTLKPHTSVGSNGKSTKKPGGVTGKGFTPGKSGNPSGRSPKVADLAKEVREFLREWHPKSKDKTRLLVLLETLAENDPKVLLHYAFGKPIEMQVVNNPDGMALGPLTVRVIGGIAPQPKKDEAEKCDWNKLTVPELVELQRLGNIAKGKIPPSQENVDAAAR